MDKTAKTIAIACDHAGYELKEFIKQLLLDEGYEVKDFGTHSEESMDYPDAFNQMAMSVNDGEYSLGIIMCGSGNGVAMVANKYPNVRAAMAWNTELAALARQHNDANILSLSGRFIARHYAWEIAQAYLNAEFEGGRHANRVNKIAIS